MRGRAPATSLGWLQVDLSLWPEGPDSSDRDSSARPLAAALLSAIAGWEAEGLLDAWSFVRKPPGLRLRLRGPRAPLRLHPRVHAWLADAEARGLVRGYRPGCYEPELHRFGGRSGLSIAHALFERDSAWALRRLLVDADASLPRWLLSAMILTDLFVQAVDDGAEVWDVWKRLGARLGAAAAPRRLSDGELAALCYEPAVIAALPPALGELLGDVQAGNAAIAAALRAAPLAGIQVGPRSWLASAAIFHANRHGLDADELRSMIGAMCTAFDPGEGAA